MVHRTVYKFSDFLDRLELDFGQNSGAKVNLGEVKSLNLKTFEPIGNKSTETTFCTSDFLFKFFDFEKFGYDFVEKREKFTTFLNARKLLEVLENDIERIIEQIAKKGMNGEFKTYDFNGQLTPDYVVPLAMIFNLLNIKHDLKTFKKYGIKKIYIS